MAATAFLLGQPPRGRAVAPLLAIGQPAPAIFAVAIAIASEFSSATTATSTNSTAAGVFKWGCMDMLYRCFSWIGIGHHGRTEGGKTRVENVAVKRQKWIIVRHVIVARFSLAQR